MHPLPTLTYYICLTYGEFIRFPLSLLVQNSSDIAVKLQALSTQLPNSDCLTAEHLPYLQETRIWLEDQWLCLEAKALPILIEAIKAYQNKTHELLLDCAQSRTTWQGLKNQFEAAQHQLFSVRRHYLEKHVMTAEVSTQLDRALHWLAWKEYLYVAPLSLMPWEKTRLLFDIKLLILLNNKSTSLAEFNHVHTPDQLITATNEIKRLAETKEAQFEMTFVVYLTRVIISNPVYALGESLGTEAATLLRKNPSMKPLSPYLKRFPHLSTTAGILALCVDYWEHWQYRLIGSFVIQTAFTLISPLFCLRLCNNNPHELTLLKFTHQVSYFLKLSLIICLQAMSDGFNHASCLKWAGYYGLIYCAQYFLNAFINFLSRPFIKKHPSIQPVLNLTTIGASLFMQFGLIVYFSNCWSFITFYLSSLDERALLFNDESCRAQAETCCQLALHTLNLTAAASCDMIRPAYRKTFFSPDLGGNTNQASLMNAAKQIALSCVCKEEESVYAKKYHHF